MLKWLDRLNGLEAAAADGQVAAGAEQQQQQYSVLDVTNDTAEVRHSSLWLALIESMQPFCKPRGLTGQLNSKLDEPA
jgi:hypothetical protein